MKKTKIVCTIGPASDAPEILEKLILGGMNVARVNFSHGSHEENKKRFDALKTARQKLEKNVAIMLDNKGPEIRIKQFAASPITLEDGARFALVCEDVAGTQDEVSVTYANLCNEVRPGLLILIDDGLIRLRVEKIEGKRIITTVENGGELSNNKSINIPDLPIKLPALTQQDIDDLIFGVQNGIDFVAASFIRTGDDVLSIRKVLNENGGAHIKIISKIENRLGVDNIDDIIRLSYGIMVARGDLGVEIPPEEVPLVQKKIIRKCNAAGKPVITATQMLDSMIRNPSPTRAEVTDVANAVFDGSDAVMLSGETASGRFPAESVRTMARIVTMAEKNLKEDARFTDEFKGEKTVTNVIAFNACQTAKVLKAAAIITPTSSGYTTNLTAKFRPFRPIIAITDKPYLQHQLALTWGVEPRLLDDCSDFERVLNQGLVAALDAEMVQEGDLVVVTAGLPMNRKGTTNMIRVETVGKYLLKGKGIGGGKACAMLNIFDGEETIDQPCILKTDIVNEQMIRGLSNIRGLITQSADITSEPALFAIRNNIPIIVGIMDIEAFPEGSMVEIDPARNMVYRINQQ
jgi:pyruvate kinase